MLHDDEPDASAAPRSTPLLAAGLAWVAPLLLAPGCASGGGAGAAGEEQAPLAAVDFTDLPVVAVDARSVTFAPGSYLRAAGTASPVMEIAGMDGVTLDFTGVEVRGQAIDADLDAARGVCVRLRDCRDVTLRGGVFGGYKVCVALSGCEGVRVEGARFDRWYGQRLRSTAVAEDQDDWLWPHLNDEGEWDARYGGAISATDCRDLDIVGCRGRKGQNGILLTRVTGSRVHDNDFSFLSGWGLGMYRASENVVAHNVFDYCVRGHSHEVYWRGQDSAGILMFESCCRNLVARNSATHSGDGVFLYAGHDLVQRGLAEATGSDENVFLENDLRYSVANSLEATFSRGNVVIGNDLSGSHQHGVWGGYSSDMVIVGNQIRDTIGGAISIEHGQNCLIADNVIATSEIGFEAYWDEDPGLVQGPYGRLRSTDSRGHRVLENRFEDNVLDLVIRGTSDIVFHGNSWAPGSRRPYFEDLGAESDETVDQATVARWLDGLDGSFPSGNISASTLTPWTGRAPEQLDAWRSFDVGELPGGQAVRAEDRGAARGGLETIVMGEWGPWDLRSNEPRPARSRPGGLLDGAGWTARWFLWDEATSDPRVDEAAWRARATAPVLTRRVTSFVNPWGSDEVRRAVGNDHFGLLAHAEVEVPTAGPHRLRVTSDDGVRVLVNGRIVIERWDHHASMRDEVVVELEAGVVPVKVEYFQITGGAALLLELEPED